jgi:hypothetical protein
MDEFFCFVAIVVVVMSNIFLLTSESKNVTKNQKNFQFRAYFYQKRVDRFTGHTDQFIGIIDR